MFNVRTFQVRVFDVRTFQVRVFDVRRIGAKCPSIAG
jgi:hypothetical protein